jgi:hypothetical protein
MLRIEAARDGRDGELGTIRHIRFQILQRLHRSLIHSLRRRGVGRRSRYHFSCGRFLLAPSRILLVPNVSQHKGRKREDDSGRRGSQSGRTVRECLDLRRRVALGRRRWGRHRCRRLIGEQGGGDRDEVLRHVCSAVERTRARARRLRLRGVGLEPPVDNRQSARGTVLVNNVSEGRVLADGTFARRSLEQLGIERRAGLDIAGLLPLRGRRRRTGRRREDHARGGLARVVARVDEQGHELDEVAGRGRHRRGRGRKRERDETGGVHF